VVPWWEVGRDLTVVGALVAGHVRLHVLARRVRVLRHRLAVHVCREVGDRDPAPGRVTVADLVRRERAAAAEITRPLSAVRRGPDRRKP